MQNNLKSSKDIRTLRWFLINVALFGFYFRSLSLGNPVTWLEDVSGVALGLCVPYRRERSPPSLSKVGHLDSVLLPVPYTWLLLQILRQGTAALHFNTAKGRI